MRFPDLRRPERNRMELLDKYLKELEMLVNTDSGKDSPEGIGADARFYAGELEKMGWHTEMVEVGYAAPCVVSYNRKADHYDLLLTGHMDTVFPKGTAAERPYTQIGDRLYGPGVCDMKAGCLSIIYALREMPAEVVDQLNIVIIFQPDEEIGSAFSRNMMCDYAKRTDVALVMEASDNEGPEPTRCIQRKGMLRLDFNFHGRAGHAGSLISNGAISAINEMAYWIIRLKELTNAQTGTTCNIGLVNGGIANNVVPAFSHMSGEVRFEREDEAQKAMLLLEELRSHAEAAGVRVERLQDHYAEPMVPSAETLAFVQRMQELEAQEGRRLAIRKRGGLSSANFLSKHVSICIDGMGPEGGKAHAVDEYLLVDSIIPSLRLTQAVIRELASHKL